MPGEIRRPASARRAMSLSKAAQQELRRLLSTVDEGGFVEPSKLTLAQYLE